MSESASVRSFEAIERMREELKRFAQRVDDGLTSIDAQTRRTIDWVEHDRPGYWKERVRRAFDDVHQAKAALHRCLMYPINDQQPSCTEERAALKKAEANLRYCLAKQDSVRRWAEVLRHEHEEYRGRVTKLRRLIEADVPEAQALLAGALTALERYTLAAAPKGADAATTAEPLTADTPGRPDPAPPPDAASPSDPAPPPGPILPPSEAPGAGPAEGTPP